MSEGDPDRDLGHREHSGFAFGSDDVGGQHDRLGHVPEDAADEEARSDGELGDPACLEAEPQQAKPDGDAGEQECEEPDRPEYVDHEGRSDEPRTRRSGTVSTRSSANRVRELRAASGFGLPGARTIPQAAELPAPRAASGPAAPPQPRTPSSSRAAILASSYFSTSRSTSWLCSPTVGAWVGAGSSSSMNLTGKGSMSAPWRDAG